MTKTAKSEIRVLLTGGGTGGHVGPALAVAQTLRDVSPVPITLCYIGSAQGIEARLAGEADIPFVAVATGKLRRSSRGPLGLVTRANVRDLGRIPQGVGEAYRAVKAFGPDVDA